MNDPKFEERQNHQSKERAIRCAGPRIEEKLWGINARVRAPLENHGRATLAHNSFAQYEDLFSFTTETVSRRQRGEARRGSEEVREALPVHA
jgi:hypothetical protein